ncbi:hypothetical protein CR51_42045 [Caballeronia megalochromosomata]|nr:hypothetical protein CR51_42045 [Caballeronia megalochromosomata]
MPARHEDLEGYDLLSSFKTTVGTVQDARNMDDHDAGTRTRTSIGETIYSCAVTALTISRQPP